MDDLKELINKLSTEVDKLQSVRDEWKSYLDEDDLVKRIKELETERDAAIQRSVAKDNVIADLRTRIAKLEAERDEAIEQCLNAAWNHMADNLDAIGYENGHVESKEDWMAGVKNKLMEKQDQ